MFGISKASKGSYLDISIFLIVTRKLQGNKDVARITCLIEYTSGGHSIKPSPFIIHELIS